MKHCLILMGCYGGQELQLDDSTAQIAITDGWAYDTAGHSEPYESVPFLVSQSRPASLRAFELHVRAGGLGTDVVQPAPVVSVTAANPAVVTVSAPQAVKLANAIAVAIEGTGNNKLDGRVFADITVGGSPVGSVITLNTVNNNGGPAVSNLGTITATTATITLPFA